VILAGVSRDAIARGGVASWQATARAKVGVLGVLAMGVHGVTVWLPLAGFCFLFCGWLSLLVLCSQDRKLKLRLRMNSFPPSLKLSMKASPRAVVANRSRRASPGG